MSHKFERGTIPMYFLGRIGYAHNFSNLNGVGMLHDDTDLFLIMRALPERPDMELIEPLLREGVISVVNAELTALADNPGRMCDPVEFPVLTTAVLSLIDPVVVYESTLLPLSYEDVHQPIIMTNILAGLKSLGRQFTADQETSLIKWLGDKPLCELLFSWRQSLCKLVRSLSWQETSFIGRVMIDFILRLCQMESYDLDAVDRLLHRAASEANQLFKRLGYCSTVKNPRGYLLLVETFRRRCANLILYDGGNRPSVLRVHDEVQFQSLDNDICITRETVIPTPVGIAMIIGPSGFGKTSLYKALSSWTASMTAGAKFGGIVHLSEPLSPSLLGLDGMNEALATALAQPDPIIAIDSFSHVAPTFSQNQPLAKGGIAWIIREIYVAIGILAATCGKLLFLMMNVESNQVSTYTDLFNGVATLTYVPHGSWSNSHWQVQFRMASGYRPTYDLPKTDVSNQYNFDATGMPIESNDRDEVRRVFTAPLARHTLSREEE